MKRSWDEMSQFFFMRAGSMDKRHTKIFSDKMIGQNVLRGKKSQFKSDQL